MRFSLGVGRIDIYNIIYIPNVGVGARVTLQMQFYILPVARKNRAVNIDQLALLVERGKELVNVRINVIAYFLHHIVEMIGK